VPYARFPRFHEVRAEENAQSVLSSLESHILPLVPGVTASLQQGIRVLDLGCGRGLIMLRLAELYPRRRFMGMDLSAEAIAFARGEAARRGLHNIECIARDVSDFDASAEPAAFECITTFDAIHDQARALDGLRGIRRALKPDGVYVMQDSSGTSHLQKDIATHSAHCCTPCPVCTA
jgi:cyclopropane fatty-acyl-phospholipid synthase-like methyltransferase